MCVWFRSEHIWPLLMMPLKAAGGVSQINSREKEGGGGRSPQIQRRASEQGCRKGRVYWLLGRKFIILTQFFFSYFRLAVFLLTGLASCNVSQPCWIFVHISTMKRATENKEGHSLKKEKKISKVTGQVLCQVQSGRPDVFTTGRTGWYFSPVPEVTKGMCHRDTRLLFT